MESGQIWGGAQAGKLNTQTPDSDVCTQATETGHAVNKPHFHPARQINRNMQSRIPLIYTHMQIGMYTDYNTHSDTTSWGLGSWGNWNLEHSPSPRTPAMGPLKVETRKVEAQMRPG